MNTKLVKNIRFLVIGHEQKVKGSDMQHLPLVENAWLLVEGSTFKSYGAMSDGCPDATEIIDAAGGSVFPAWCDSHTHLVFAGSREGEFADRIKGLTYEEIAQRGGGILNSAQRLQQTNEADLYRQAKTRLQEVIGYGTGTIEIKSGYGLSVESELKMLRIIRHLSEESPAMIKSTFLGAHAIPEPYKNNRDAYIRLITDEMLPLIAAEKLADYIDVFCEKVAFSVEETDRILTAGAKYGLPPKVHTNQFNSMGGIETSIKHGAVSVDHLEVVNDLEVVHLQEANTIATLLPSAPFFINDHYPPARKLLNADLCVALATDYNPGSTPSGNMPFVLSLACIKMRMTPEEAINAATINGAAALEWTEQTGSIHVNKVANFFITSPIPSIAFLPYAFGSNLVKKVFLKGEEVV